ncbi:MAG: hypothetical protein AAB710_01160, partial [Patescibacteria group bacterium]
MYSPDDVVRIGLARIYQNQLPDGGFAYYFDLPADPYLTMHIINTLADMRDAGYEIDADRLARAASYLSREVNSQIAQSAASPRRGILRSVIDFIYPLSPDADMAPLPPPPPDGDMSSDSITQPNNDFVILAAYALSRVPGYKDNGAVSDYISRIAGDVKYVREESSHISLAYLAIILTNGYPEDLKNNVYKELENRISIDGRGASLSLQGRSRLYQYYETPIKDTALLVKALTADKRDIAVFDKILRWILASRSKDGAWGSTNNSLTVFDALTDFLNWKKENESEFNLSMALDSEQVGEVAFDKTNLLQPFEKFLPMDILGKGKIQTFTFTKRNINDAP